ncbi:Cytochrome c1 heme lyase, variant 2 [Entomophthora muscae]|nr:Cytochrome c1 heme lyase, variant 2 [Entomophthora muscae]
MAQALIEEPMLLAALVIIISMGIFLSMLAKENQSSKESSLTEEQKWRNKIQEIIQTGEKRIGKLASDFPCQVDSFLEKYPEPQKDNEEYVAAKQLLEDNHTKVGELLLRVLIGLDGLEFPAELPELRQERRTVIKETQARINAADKQWSRVKNH